MRTVIIHNYIHMEDRSSDHLVLGGLLFLVFSLVVALVFVYTRAADTTTGQSPTTSATIDNQAPAVDSVNIAYVDNGDLSATSGNIGLTLGGQTQVVVWGTLSDANGEADIDEVSVVLRRSGATNADSCTVDLNDCYTASGTQAVPGACEFTADTATTKHYACTVNLEFFADGTTAGGQFALGATSSASASVSGNGSNVIHNIDQKGNVIADVTVEGGVMTCSALGTIPVGNQKWALAANGYESATALTATAFDTDLAVQYQTDDNYVSNPSRKQLFWSIGIA